MFMCSKTAGVSWYVKHTGVYMFSKTKQKKHYVLFLKLPCNVFLKINLPTTMQCLFLAFLAYLFLILKIVIKGIIHPPKMKILSTFSHSYVVPKPVHTPLFYRTQKKIIWSMSVIKQFLFPLTSIVWTKNTFEVNGKWICLIFIIL